MPVKSAVNLRRLLIPLPWRLPNGIKNASDGELESSSEVCEEWSWICGGAVVLGVLAEVAIAWCHPLYDSFWERWGSVIADGVVMLGVAGEVQFSMMVFRRDKELKRRSDEKVANANKIAAQATKDAADARERTAEIEKLTAWRHISAVARSAIAEAIRPNATMLDIQLEFENGSPEAFSYAREIGALFRASGVEKIQFVGNSFIIGYVFGLQIGVPPDTNISSIANAFALAGLEPNIVNDDMSKRRPSRQSPPNLYIFVGAKPPPVFDLSGAVSGESNI